MSRSYKKSPYATDNMRRKEQKRYANKKVRARLKDMDEELQGGDYKKVYESYNISDFSFTETWEDYWKSVCENCEKLGKEKPNEKEAYRKWKTIYMNK